MGSRVGLIGVLVKEHPVGVLVGQLAGQSDSTVGALVSRRRDDLSSENLKGLAPLDRNVLGKHDLDWVAPYASDHGQGDPGVPR